MTGFNKLLSNFCEYVNNFVLNDATTKINTNSILQRDSNDNARSFLKNLVDKGNDFSSKNEIIFSKGIVLIEGIDLYSIWNSENSSNELHEYIWNSLHFLYITALTEKYGVTVKQIKTFVKANGENFEGTKEELTTVSNIITELKLKDKVEKMMNTAEEELEKDDSDEQGDSFGALPNLFNGPIGDLAKEITQEIDPSTINLENPQELLQNLMSGNFDLDNDKTGLGNLVKSVTEKVQSRLASGSLNQEELVNQANNLMGKFSNLGSMFANAGAEEDADGEPDLSNLDLGKLMRMMQNNPSVQQAGQHMARNADYNSRRERLRKKLDSKVQTQQKK